MATGQLTGVIQNLRRSALLREGDGLTDGQLLDAFLAHADEGAFEALVHRHAPMVWGVCLRTLGRSHDAEDAFQATFLVLVKKADSIWPRDMVGNWLHGVSYRTALKAKAVAAKRRAHEKQVDEMPAKEVHDEKVWHDLQPLLDRELNRLADKYRVPVVLCDLEGKSQREAARQLGWPEGTLTTRLTRARQMLAKRLTKHGLALSAGGLALILAQNAASACAPAPLVVSTINAATLVAAGQTATLATSASVAALTEGVVKAMFLTKVKSVLMIVLAFTLLATGGGFVTHRVLASRAVEAEPVPFVHYDFADEFTFFQERVAGGERRPANPAAYSGKIVAVAADAKSFTIETPPANRGDEPGKQEVKITDKTKLTFFGVGTGGAKLATGQTAQVWLSEGSKDAATITLQGNQATNRTADFTGRVTGVSKDGATLSFVLPSAVRGEVGKTVEVKITAKTSLTYSFIAKGGTKPAEGYSAQVWFEKGSKDTAASVSFSGTDGPERGRVVQKIDGAGKVVGVAKDGKSITLEVPPTARGEAASKVDYKIDDKTQVTYQNVSPGGDHPAEGQLARVWLADGSKDTAATLLLLETPKQKHTTVRGKVSGVAKDGKSFTIEIPPTERGVEAKKVNVVITANTRVVYMGVGVNGAQPTEDYFADVAFEEGSQTEVRQVILGSNVGGGSRR